MGGHGMVYLTSSLPVRGLTGEDWCSMIDLVMIQSSAKADDLSFIPLRTIVLID